MAGVEPWRTLAVQAASATEIDILKVLAASVATIVVAYLGYLGARFTSGSAKEGVFRTAAVTENADIREAWKEIVDPLRAELKRVSGDLATERQTRIDREREDETRRAEEKRIVKEQIDRLTEKVDVLTIEVKHWKTMAKTIARWATVLRDEIIRLQGDVPVIPDELLMVQLLDERDDDRRA